jgi:hypothetical protein
MSSDITFGSSASETVLEQFGKTVDEEGYIIDEETGERTTTRQGEEIKIEEFGGIGKGSEIFVKNNFNSVADFVEYKHDLK